MFGIIYTISLYPVSPFVLNKLSVAVPQDCRTTLYNHFFGVLLCATLHVEVGMGSMEVYSQPLLQSHKSHLHF